MPVTLPSPPEKWSRGWGQDLVQVIQRAFGDWDANGLRFKKNFSRRYCQSQMSAAGTSLATAATIDADSVEITTAGTGSSCVAVPSMRHGMQLFLTNAAAVSVSVFPQTTDQINTLGTGSAYALGTGKSLMLNCPRDGQAYGISGS